MADKTTPPTKKSKKFSIAREGDTTDGRVIERAWIEQMAETYSTATYAARINLEHFKGVIPMPDSPFGAYGTVVSLSTEERDGKLCLLAEINANDYLIALNKKDQKVYTSCEIDPNFAKTGKAYLVGLAVTDSPASLGCDMLQFAATATHNPFTARKLSPTNLFSAAQAATLEFEEISTGPSLLDRVKALFAHQSQTSDARFSDVHSAVEEIAAQVVQVDTKLNQCGAGIAKVEVLATAHEKLAQEFAELKAQLSTQPGNQTRPPATGGNGDIKTDC